METARLPNFERTVLAGAAVRLGTRKLSRAHVALERRPNLVAELSGALRAIEEALSSELKCSVSIQANAGAATTTFRSVAEDAVVLEWDLGAFDRRAFLELDVPSAVAFAGRLSGATSLGPAHRLTRIERAAVGYLALIATKAVCTSRWTTTKVFPRFLSAASRSKVIADAEEAEPYFQTSVAASLEGQVFSMRLLFPASTLHSALVSMPPAPVEPRSDAGAAGQALIAVRRFLGRSSVSGAELRGLTTGDIVVFDNVSFAGGRLSGSGRIRAETFELAGIFQGEGFVPATYEEPNMARNDFESGTDLPVEIEVELGRVRVSLAELASLRAGSLLSIPANVRDPVTLRVGDRAIARAELVDIEGQLGARILALVP